MPSSYDRDSYYQLPVDMPFKNAFFFFIWNTTYGMAYFIFVFSSSTTLRYDLISIVFTIRADNFYEKLSVNISNSLLEIGFSKMSNCFVLNTITSFLSVISMN
jgi:hypothetical protein